ncbi:MAG TPA: hypothetical protein VNM24_04585 [Burkholderiales bacterium]|jgi:hypothetical protein|nr:hypothetical protein [Burkholderiales bacterium]
MAKRRHVLIARSSRARARPGAPAPRLGRWLRLTWWAVCLAVLAWWFVSIDLGTPLSQARRPEQQQILEGIMAVLAFPAGLFWIWVLPSLMSLSQTLGVTVERWPWYTHPLAAWTGAALLGHLQWFWLLRRVFTLRASDG